MTWNEPGNSGNKDPWGNRNKQDGPPDLDELVKKLQSKIGGIFGGGKRGGGSDSDGSGSIFSLVALGALVLWAISGFYIINEGTRGVITQLGAYHETTMPGLHWHPRLIQKLDRVDINNVATVDIGITGEDFLMLTKNLDIIDIEVSIQYRINDPQKYLFNVASPRDAVIDATESALREVVGKTNMDAAATEGRSELGQNVKIIIQSILEDYQVGISIINVNIAKAQPPREVQDAVEDVVKADRDKDRYISQAETYSNDILPKARGAAARQVEDAKAYKEQVIAEAEGEAARFIAILEQYQKAPRVTRERLYLETMEYILANSNKVVVDVKGGNSMFYVPLEQFLKKNGVQAPQQKNNEPAPTGTQSSSQQSSSTETDNRDYLRDRERR